MVAATACPQSSLMKELAGGLACLLLPAAIFAVTTVLLKLKTSQMVMEKLMSLQGYRSILSQVSCIICRYIMSTFQPYGGVGWPLACLLPPSAISLFATVLLKLEGSQRGVAWNTVNLQITSQFPFSAATVFQMLAFDILLYSTLAWYLDRVSCPCLMNVNCLLFYLDLLLGLAQCLGVR